MAPAGHPRLERDIEKFEQMAAAALEAGPPPPRFNPAPDINAFLRSGQYLLPPAEKLSKKTIKGREEARKARKAGKIVDPLQRKAEEKEAVTKAVAKWEVKYGLRGSGGDHQAPQNVRTDEVATVVSYLDDAYHEFRDRHNCAQSTAPAGMKIPPLPHQLRAASMAQRSRRSYTKGLLIADPPGYGKTLPPLIAIKNDQQPNEGPSVVVCPPSCAQQWMSEIKKFFGDTLKAFLLTEKLVPLLDLYDYDVIVTTYPLVTSELTRINSFNKAFALYEAGLTTTLPKRPRLTLLSQILDLSGTELIGSYLVLDEAHNFKNPYGKMYQAVKKLRERFESCIMLTGTPIDNTWMDAWPLVSLIRGHGITSRAHFQRVFSQKSPKNSKGTTRKVPTGKYLERLIRMLSVFTVCRPIDRTKRTNRYYRQFKFNPPRTELKASNDYFDEYKKTAGASNGPEDAYGNEEERLVKWGALIKAEQAVYHPELIAIMELERYAAMKDLELESTSDEAPTSAEAKEKLDKFMEKIQRDGNWHSARVDVICDLVNRSRDLDLQARIIIMDGSVHFLDVVRIALSNDYDPVATFSYDGRKSPGERHVTLLEFSEHPGPAVLLATRGTGGQGLNVQAANVLIRCSPWWKTSWELQAEGRIDRPGQEKDVFIWEIVANGARVERNRQTVRDRKERLNSRIISRLTLVDYGAMPEKKTM